MIKPVFFQNSTRTRTSFELAANVFRGFGQHQRFFVRCYQRETLWTCPLTLTQCSRTASSSSSFKCRRSASTRQGDRAAIVNAGDGANEHPTQALLDAMTIREHKKKIKGLNVAIIGDNHPHRVARSNIHLLTKLGAKVRSPAPAPWFRGISNISSTMPSFRSRLIQNPKSKAQNF